MTKIHCVDLTKNSTPWCLLHANTQARMQAEPEVQVLAGDGTWKDLAPLWTPTSTYRVKPKPVRVVRWANVYPNSNDSSCISRASADLYKGPNRLCVFRIECDEDGGNPTISREEG